MFCRLSTYPMVLWKRESFSFETDIKNMKWFILKLLILLCFDSDLAANGSLCRSRGIRLESHQFNAETCALCYLYMPKTKFKSNFAKWNLTRSGNQSSFPLMGSKLTNGSLAVCKLFCYPWISHFWAPFFLDCGRCIWWGKSFTPNFPWWLLNQALERLLPSCQRMLSKNGFWRM